MTSLGSIKFWPKADRPREKLLRVGEHRLTDSELLGILIQSGVKGVSATALAKQILRKFGSFRGISKYLYERMAAV